MLKTNIPNILTLSNLAAGLMAIIALQNGHYWQMVILLGVSLVFDFADGLVARALGVHSELGKQLDSLADLVSFGVVPGLFLFQMFRLAPQYGEPVPDFLAYLALLVPVFSALRLGKFNLDERQSDNFIGLPTPANAMLIISLGVWGLKTENPVTAQIIFHPLLLTVLAIGSALLLVAEIPMWKLKVTDWRWKALRGKIFVAVLLVILFAVLRFRALAFIIPLYLLSSIIFKPRP